MRALILGVGGQDGSYLAELLLDKGYDVHGVVRRSSVNNLVRIEHIKDKITLHQGDLSDGGSIDRIIRDVSPREVYNLADQDHVGWSYGTPGYSFDVTCSAVCRLLESVRQIDRGIKVFQPVTALMFSTFLGFPQSEETRFDPQSPYAIAKLAAYHLCRYYRDAHGLFVSTGICFNHDSVRRQGDYLLHSIARQSIVVCKGKKETVVVGSLDAVVDIGSAEEFAGIFHGILQFSKPGDYVIGTGVSVTVRELIRIALDEAGKVLGKPAKAFLVEDRALLRPGRTTGKLVADNGKLASFGLKPEKTSETVLREIVQHYIKKGEGWR